MNFRLVRQADAGLPVPMAVFKNLYDAKETDLKVILYVLQKGDVDLVDITSHLQITVAAAQSSLLFWSDKGLILYEDTALDRPKKVRLSRQEILQISDTQPEVNVLVNQLQEIYGYALNEKGMAVYITLYLQYNVPVEVILILAAYLVPQLDKTAAYTASVIQRLFEKEGITDAQKAEEYIQRETERNKRYAAVCAMFRIEKEKLTKAQKTTIDSWWEKLCMDGDMIQSAIETAGGNRSIRYCNGILKSWSQKGYKKPEDIQEYYSSADNGVAIADEEDVMLRDAAIIPVFEGGN